MIGADRPGHTILVLPGGKMECFSIIIIEKIEIIESIDGPLYKRHLFKVEDYGDQDYQDKALPIDVVETI